MTKQQLEKMECRGCIAQAKLQRAIDKGIKMFKNEQNLTQLEVQFFGRPL